MCQVTLLKKKKKGPDFLLLLYTDTSLILQTTKEPWTSEKKQLMVCCGLRSSRMYTHIYAPHARACVHTHTHTHTHAHTTYTEVFSMQNVSGGANQKCVAAFAPKDEAWKCISSSYAETYTSSLLFGLNSIYDSWQLANILQIPCKPPDCSPQYMKYFEMYGKVGTSMVINFSDTL